MPERLTGELSPMLQTTINDELVLVNIRGRSSDLPMNVWIGPRLRGDQGGLPPLSSVLITTAISAPRRKLLRDA